ncbi:ABC-type multidrug transport system, ATPase component [Gottschalkia purinilytica]|uniref:ABC-type multidrug transport system, ATPase component n=1 Tax=Gottschalkia purinilytica TaxID=1503 RepID=A0A0L0W8B0_GOTPU|nr:ABC transporter ATP-binding protein [Gottschalkia purinilytica]KNF07687.1 ABC-type multidrug transport system, ATPase component [Gottschalkia purinilytica]
MEHKSLTLKNITKSFDNKKILKDISFTFQQGEIYALLGRNGAGKTTLFNILAEELKKDSGEVLISYEGNIKKLTSDHLSYVYSNPILPEFLTGYEFIKFFMDINKDKLNSSLNIDDYFDIIKINKEDRHKLIKAYSHGMKNKIQMLMFMISRPPVILLDEPLTSLDVVVALEIKKLLREIKKDHIIIFSTHILELAKDLCDEIVVLNEGKLEMIDKELLKNPNFEEEIMEMLREKDSDD